MYNPDFSNVTTAEIVEELDNRYDLEAVLPRLPVDTIVEHLATVATVREVDVPPHQDYVVAVRNGKFVSGCGKHQTILIIERSR